MKQEKQINTNKPTFDLKTHVRDGKGNIAKENHYRLTIKDGVKEFERPPGSGFFYDEAGTLTRTVKVTQPVKPVEKTAAEFENDVLRKQLAELQAQMDATKPEVVTSLEQVPVEQTDAVKKVRPQWQAK